MSKRFTIKKDSEIASLVAINGFKILRAIGLGILLAAGCLSCGSSNLLNRSSEKLGWFFLRNGEEPSPDESLMEMIAVGDIMLGRGAARVEQPFQSVSSLLMEADLTVGNFEGVMDDGYNEWVEQNYSTSSPIMLVAPPRSAQNLHQAGFDVVSLANNHSLDLEQMGLEHTAGLLIDANMQVIGVGTSQKEAYQPVVRQIGSLRIALMAVNGVNQPNIQFGQEQAEGWSVANWDIHAIEPVLGDIRKTADIVVVYVHWGEEYELHAGSAQKRAAHQLIESGADVVIGSHPHVVQETEIYQPDLTKNRIGFIAYSLGNFVFDQYEDRVKFGLALKFYFDEHGLRAVRPLAVENGPAPKWMGTDAAKPHLDSVRPKPTLLALSCSIDQCKSQMMDHPEQTHADKNNQADLTGDGTAERVLLENGHAFIYGGDKIAWQSPSEWNVLDFAVGDPNNDGRQELALALEKRDARGEMKSHPFLIGYRGGVYRQVWGGSAVAYPILEIDLADLDADRSEELIVLEARGNGEQALTVWKWQGWVFMQTWSSAAGHFSDLNVIRENSKGPIITINRLW